MTPLAIPGLGTLALEESAFRHLRDTIERDGTGRAMTEMAEAWAKLEAARPSAVRPRSEGAVRVIPVVGVMWQRSYWGASTPQIGSDVLQAAKDKGVSAIVLEVDSPGGQVDGVPEAAAKIRAARKLKPVVAVANTQAASAAYWLAGQASELWVSPSGEVGSVGVFTMHTDFSGLAEKEGVKVTYVYAGEYKVEGNEFAPLGDEARDALQSRVNDAYGLFLRDLASGRGVPVDDVRNGFGRGRMVGARKAVEAGMADKVGTLEQAISHAATLGKARADSMVSLAEAETKLAMLELD